MLNKTQIESIKEEASNLLSLHVRQMKFEVVEKLAQERAKFIFATITTFAFLLIAFLGSIFFALIANEYTNSDYLGYGIVALFWTVLILLVVLLKVQIKHFLFENFINKNIPA